MDACPVAWPVTLRSCRGAVAITELERLGFELFLVRCSIKLAGVFESELWATVLSQASWGEPAVMQAILALSLAHKTR
jgi:hypothetical protein